MISTTAASSDATTPDILCLVHRVPYPPNRGDRIRSFHLLQYLAQRARVHLAFPATEAVPDETMRVLNGLCHRVAAEPIGDNTRWLRAAWSITTGRSATEGLFRSTRLRQRVKKWLRETRFDAAVAVCSSMVQYLELPELESIPTVIDLVDVDSQKWFDYARQSQGPKRFLLNLEAERLRQLESSLPGRFDAVTVVAEREADVFESFSPHRPRVLRNGVDLDYFAASGTPVHEEAQTCVFVGALDYEANVDGAGWFCRNIWPRVRERFPQAVFRLVGSRPNAEARRLGHLPGVELVGEVPDVRPYLREAGVVAVPLRVARGVQNKVLEAMASSKPVVVTPAALRGINATDGVQLLSAETESQWVEALGALFTDCEKRKRLGSAGRAFVEEEYRWSNQLSKLADLPGLGPCLKRNGSRLGEQVAV